MLDKNLSVEEAQRRLQEQFAPRSEPASGIRVDDFDAATEGLERLEAEVRVGHDPKKQVMGAGREGLQVDAPSGIAAEARSPGPCTSIRPF